MAERRQSPVRLLALGGLIALALFAMWLLVQASRNSPSGHRGGAESHPRSEATPSRTVPQPSTSATASFKLPEPTVTEPELTEAPVELSLSPWGDGEDSFVPRGRANLEIVARHAGAPVEGAEVEAFQLFFDCHEDHPGGVTNWEGTFTQSLATADYHRLVITVRKPGFAAARAQIEIGGGDQRVELELSPEHAVTGRVTDSAGRAVVGTRVSLFLQDPWGGGLSESKTDDRGEFVLRGSDATGDYSVWIEPEASTGLLRASRDLGPGVRRADFQLANAGSVVIERIDLPPDVPALDQTVRLLRIDTELPDNLGPWDAVEFPVVVQQVPAGTYRAIAWGGELAPAASEPFLVDPYTQPPRVWIQRSAGRTIQGRVVDRLGTPLSGARVELLVAPEGWVGASAATTPQGQFQLNYAVTHAARLRITHLSADSPNYLPAWHDVPPGGDLILSDTTLLKSTRDKAR